MRLPALFALLVFAVPANAQITSMLDEDGLAKTEIQLAALPNKTPNDLFALGAVRFLRGVEKTLQTRWQSNARIDDLDIPVLRLPVPPNPDPKPFEAALIAGLFSELARDMDAARAALAEVPEGVEIGLDINLNDLWFDVNMNGTRDQGESVMEIGAGTLMARPRLSGDETQPDALMVRFDTADLAWLTAYTHLLSGVSELVIAFDPTDAIAEVMQANTEMDALLGDTQQLNAMDMQFGHWVDQFAMVYGALNKRPDAAHTQAAHAHFLKMIAQNRVFWAAVAQETDNENEWIPNAGQTAAMGFDLPPETSEVWQAVLGDGEKLLNGELLVPYWRIAPAGGVNVKKLFMDPPAVDIVTWVQGSGLLPYMERGPLADTNNLRVFEQMVTGDALIFSFLLN